MLILGCMVGFPFRYLTESGAAALATCNNMQALSYLHQVQAMLQEQGDEFVANREEKARVESLIGQVGTVCQRNFFYTNSMPSFFNVSRAFLPRTLRYSLLHLTFSPCKIESPRLGIFDISNSGTSMRVQQNSPSACDF